MRLPSGVLVVLSIVAALACKAAASGDPIATPGVSTPEPAAPATPGEPVAGTRTAEQACPDINVDAGSSGQACTEMGCVSGFHLSVLPLEAWPHGDYRYVLDIDGRTVTCEGTLPLRGCEARNITCSDPAFGIVESGCALDASAHAFGGVMMPGFPSRVHLRVELDGRAVADEDLTVSWNRAQPNGSGCGPICCQAGDEVTLKF